MEQKIFLFSLAVAWDTQNNEVDIEKVKILLNILSKPSFSDLREGLKTTRNMPIILSSIRDLLDNIFHEENPFVTYAWLIY